MEETNNRASTDVYTNVIKAGKRTYFFDVKQTKSGEKYLTITESKRIFDEFQNKFFYEKHKIFLYKEDFANFIQGLSDSIDFIEGSNGNTAEGLIIERTNNPNDITED